MMRNTKTINQIQVKSLKILTEIIQTKKNQNQKIEQLYTKMTS